MKTLEVTITCSSCGTRLAAPTVYENRDDTYHVNVPPCPQCMRDAGDKRVLGLARVTTVLVECQRRQQAFARCWGE
jgi:NAD-dependent SIR2 family protein deacetylase